MRLNRPLQIQMQLQRLRSKMLTPGQAGAQQAAPYRRRMRIGGADGTLRIAPSTANLRQASSAPSMADAGSFRKGDGHI
jgi:hypothetical protein